MRLKNHIKILIIATLVWLFFLLLGMPDYYLQYSTNTMIWFTILLLIPFSIIIWYIFKPIKKSKRIKISLWYALYFTVPLAVYDYLFCGIYLDYGFRFITVFWFLSVYYLILWFLFPGIAFILNGRYNS
jgi:hypothetical protein